MSFIIYGHIFNRLDVLEAEKSQLQNELGKERQRLDDALKR